MFKKQRNIMLYKERTEFEEFGLSKKAYQECRICRAVYHTKSWHHRDALDIDKIKKEEMVQIARCPACKMIADHQYEGILTIENIPARHKTELSHLIRAYTYRAYQKDCQHRLIAVNKEKTGIWIVTTTENQLANKLAHKIRDVFNKVDVKVAYSKAPDDTVRARVVFEPLLTFMS
jgi:hypothetical protein